MQQNRKQVYVPAVGPRLRRLLLALFGLFAILSVNAVYLASITFAEWLTAQTYQDYFYQYMFLAHLALGLLIIVPVLVYGTIHISNARNRPNRRAVRVGYALFTSALILLVSGLLLTRGLPLVELKHPAGREVAYWVHLLAPLAVAWLFVLHRLAGKPIRWRAGGMIAAGAAGFALVMLALQTQDPRAWGQVGPDEGERYFQPSLSRTASGKFIPAESLMMDGYCSECHADAHETWSVSMHRFASFNNPVYRFSVRNTREFSLERDGNVRASRFCAGCHDPVPFFSGAFDDPEFDDVNHPTSQAGITCTACHAITNINSVRGNADYTIEEPLHYPFARSDSEILQWVNRLLVKAKPAFHKKTFLKPLHKRPEFCAQCHKVHLPVALNDYKWLRGQNHYDSYHLSGVSGHGVRSFYYPEEAEDNCNGCHMKRVPSDDFGAQPNENGVLTIHDHQFPSANTAIPHLLDLPEWVNNRQRDMLEGSVEIDLFALRREGRIDGNLLGPIAEVPVDLEPGETYLVEVVVRTVGMGHHFTQGTADSNEVWVRLEAKSAGRLIGQSGEIDPVDGSVDPWAHRINAYVLDFDGNRIDRRNPENIFVALYNHQIPPGAAAVIHYRLEVPPDLEGPVELSADVNYRKFDTTLMRYVEGDEFDFNDLPIVQVTSDSVTLGGNSPATEKSIPTWKRWNDYGIGLLRAGQLRQAERAFSRVEDLGHGLGALNLARTYIREGRLEEAVDALDRAATAESPAYPWAITYWTAVVNLQNGYLEQAIGNFTDVLETRFPEARAKGFDFSQDYRLLDQLGRAWFQWALTLSDAGGDPRYEERMKVAADYYRRALDLNPERSESHYGLARVYGSLGREEDAQRHMHLYDRYRVDDNARDRVIAQARARDPAADHAADPIVIYDLDLNSQRPSSE